MYICATCFEPVELVVVTKLFEKKNSIKGCFNTPLEHTPSNLYQKAKEGFLWISFIVGGLGDCRFRVCSKGMLQQP